MGRCSRQFGDTDLAGNAQAFLAYQAVSGDQKAGVEIAAQPRARLTPLFTRLDTHRGLPVVDAVVEKAVAV